MLRALLLVIGLIIYVCLYPFRFHALPPDPGGVLWRSWPVALDRFVTRDALVNVLLYLPFGILAFLALARIRTIWLRLLLPVIFAVFLSTAVELVQLMDANRSSSTFDVACNATGAALGAIAGRLYANRVSGMLKSTEQGLAAAPSASLLFGLWLLYQLFPLFPAFSIFLMRAQLKLFLTHLSFLPLEAVQSAIEWLAMAAVLQKIVGPRKIRTWMFALLLVLPVRLVIFHHTLTLAELGGAMLACVIWSGWLNRMPRRALLMSGLIVAGLILHDLSPYHLSRTPQPFSWTPFAAFIEMGTDWGAVMFLRKSFWYGSAVWAFYEAGHGFLRPGIAVALLLGLLEYIQRYLPGRTPEISDPLLALFLALLLWLLEERAPAPARKVSTAES